MESSKTDQPARGVATQPQRKLSAKEILSDIREGMSDQGLEQKYRLAPEGREKVFKTLIAKGLMTDAELQWRNNLLKTQEASSNVPAAQANPIPTPVAPRNTDEKSSPVTAGCGMSPPASREESKAGATPLLRSMTILRSFALHDMKIVAVGTILGGICAAVVTTYWGTATTSAKLLGKLGKPQSTTSWKWIIVCAIVGAILAFCVSRVLKKRRSVGTPRQPLPPRHTPRSAGPVSAEEIEEAIKRMESARRDMFGIAGDVGILGIGAAGGGIAAVAVAAFFGATSIWGVTRAGKWMGLSVHGGTPWIWIIGCAVVGAALAFSVSRLIRSGAQAAERRKRNIDELKRDVEKRRKEAEKSTVDKDKFGKLVESLTMLLSNGKITPEESDGLIEGIKSGGMSYEFAFSFIEELLRE